MIDWDLVWTIALGLAFGRGIVVICKVIFGVPLKMIKDILKIKDNE